MYAWALAFCSGVKFDMGFSPTSCFGAGGEWKSDPKRWPAIELEGGDVQADVEEKIASARVDLYIMILQLVSSPGIDEGAL